MSHSLDQFATQRDVALRDSVGKLPSGDRDALLLQAIVQRYSKDRPREISSDAAGNGTQLLPMPVSGGDNFEDGFSIIRSIEFPSGRIPPSYIPEDDWRIYRAPASGGGLQVMLASTPAAADTLRFLWT